MEWNFPLKVGVSSEFHFILYDIAVLETTKWNSPLRLALGSVWLEELKFNKYCNIFILLDKKFSILD
jgi:hypothetical protein